MDADIALILLQDGVVNGAIYALLALSLVLVFAVTRVILIPMGELVAFGGLTDAALQSGRVPGSLMLLAALGLAACIAGALADRRLSPALLLETIALPAAIAVATILLAPGNPGPIVAAVLAIAIVAPMAPFLYRVAFQPLAQASVLVLLIASVGVHLALNGLGLVFFGPEGFRATGFTTGQVALGSLSIPGQSLWIVGLTVLTMVGLALFFGLTLAGKALRATAINRLGARLVGISTALSGRIAFALAGLIGAASGVLIVPLTTLYYDSGFLIGLKGFVAAIIAGLASYPIAAAAALLVGCVESFSSFYASAFKEVIVFTIIIPVLLWRSLRSEVEEE
ncbi:MAG: branched-chain amino acid ABC transporter permease [Pseudomonadota bacterium]|nr:branched-chain amino acid ABC transporter permease [Pseudomonadota bacterium]